MKKILTITSLAGTTTFGLFALMAYVVNNDQIVPVETLPTPIVEFAQIQDEKPANTRVRFENNPPPTPKPMPRTFEAPAETSVEGEFDFGNPSFMYKFLNMNHSFKYSFKTMGNFLFLYFMFFLNALARVVFRWILILI